MIWRPAERGDAVMKVYLIVTKGSKQGMPIPIGVDLFMLGSDKICQLRAPNLPPKQCALIRREKKVFVCDFDSGAPTLINDQLLPPGEEWPLHARDRIDVGGLHFMVQFHEKALSGRDLEEWAASCLDIEEKRNILDESDFFHRKTNAADAAAQIIDKMNVIKGQVMGRLRIGREQGVTTVRINDTIIVEEAEIQHIKKELTDNLNRPNLRILLDLKNVRRMSTNAISMITDFSRWARPFGSKVAICRIRPELKDMMAIMQVANIPIFPDKPTAYASKW
jgi:anti-anti-sigma regulatory factor